MRDVDPSVGVAAGDESARATLPQRFRLGDLIVDRRSRTIRRDDESITLPNLSWNLLLALARRGRGVTSQDDLLAEVWPDTFVGEEVLTQRIKLLRQSLGDDSRDPRYVETVRGAGYRLAVDIEPGEHGEPVERDGKRLRRVLAWLAGALLLALIATWLANRSETETADDIAIAVLPFEDLGPATETDRFVAALHDEIIGRLARVSALRVSPRTSVLGITDEERSVSEIASRLGVDAVLEGSVRRAGERITVSVRLFDDDESQLWAESYEREVTLENLLAIQNEVAERIAAALRVELSASERQVLARLPTGSLEAYNLYLLGRGQIYQSTPEDLTRAIELLRQALEIDPEFAEAWAALASAYSFLGTNYGLLPPRQANREAKDAVLRALALDPGLVEARIVYGNVLAWYDWDWQAAEREYLEARRQAPDFVLGYALLLSTQGRHAEATRLLETLLDRYPADPWVRANAAWRHLEARNYDRVIELAREVRDHPDFRTILGWARLGQGRAEDATRAFRAAIDENGRTPAALAALAVGYAVSGREEEARGILAELVEIDQRGYVSPALIAQVHARLGEVDAALTWLERAVERRARDVIFLQVDPVWDGLREEPRFQEIVARVGLTE